MTIRTPRVIGDLWPLCGTCGHIAQSHDDHDTCSEKVRGQCPTCGTYQDKVPCKCDGYKGPSLEEFMETYMTPEEIEHYSKQWKLSY